MAHIERLTDEEVFVEDLKISFAISLAAQYYQIEPRHANIYWRTSMDDDEKSFILDIVDFMYVCAERLRTNEAVILNLSAWVPRGENQLE